MSLNSALGQRIGVFRAAAVNYFVGLAGALAVGWRRAGSTPDWWAWTGGLLGVAIVIGSNLAVPRLSAAVATLLIVVGALVTRLGNPSSRKSVD
jgi:transporter family-2 protein